MPACTLNSRARQPRRLSTRHIGHISVALIILSGCGLETEPSAISLDSAPITTQESLVETTTGSTTTTTSTPAMTTILTEPGTTAPIAPTTLVSTPTDSRPLALDVLAGISVMRERGDGYDRDLFEHWITVGGCSTRENVLIRDSLTPAQVDPFGCRVV
ncbi:MAG: hypothetical protein RLZ37_1484, partial [Actinomycetota bacterium]